MEFGADPAEFVIVQLTPNPEGLFSIAVEDLEFGHRLIVHRHPSGGHSDPAELSLPPFEIAPRKRAFPSEDDAQRESRESLSRFHVQ